MNVGYIKCKIMKKQNSNIYKCLVLILIIFLQSCKQDELENFASKKGASTNVSIKGQTGQIKKDVEVVRIPVEIQLSGSATQAFDAHLELDGDAITNAITGDLLPNTLAMPVESIFIPETVVIPFGSTNAVFDVLVSVSDLEKFYFTSKKVAFALKLSEVTKGNTINEEKNIGIISIDPRGIISATEMHAISIKNGGGGKLEVSGTSNYLPSVASIGIPLDVSLSGVPSRSFTVDVAINSDTVAVLKSKGVIPQNAVMMKTGEFEMPAQVTVDQISSTGKLDLTIPSETLLKYRNNKIALVVQLTGSSKHVVDPVNRTVVLLIDPASIIAANKYTIWLPLLNKPQFNVLNRKFNS
ncbi:hypothetical protein CPT03_12155 [Pedobacter ginsengisoli]|uniref:DUF1735 domain-containing protein n=2 Tax=Pedobacter ginsengisoli TaxID=363852 RepID=A0A2D1U6D4_9SPHI|nr:hypothetical protein CPT03_12155 [Pedobacter ginsengisoli]